MRFKCRLPGQAVAIFGSATIASCLTFAGPAQGGLISEDLIAASAASVDAMAISLNPAEAPAPTDDGSASTSTSGAGLPLTGHRNQQILGHSSNASDLALAIVSGPNFRRRSGSTGLAGLGSGGGLGGLRGMNVAGLSNSSPGSGGTSSAGDTTASIGGANSAPVAGTDVSSPLLPSSFSNGSYQFNSNVSAGDNGNSAPLYADPPVAPGFTFTTNTGTPNFASVDVTTPLPNTPLLTVSYGGQSGQVAPGTTFDFPSGGVSTFQISGISPADVATGADFETQLTFTGTGDVSFQQTPNPEPASVTLLALGAAGLFGVRARRSRRSKSAD